MKVSTKTVKFEEGVKVEKTVLETQKGKCEICGREGKIRYFVAAKLPKPIYLCDRDYLILRARLEVYLRNYLDGVIK